MTVQVEGKFDLHRFLYLFGGRVMERTEALTNYYTTHNEDARLTSKRDMQSWYGRISDYGPLCREISEARYAYP